MSITTNWLTSLLTNNKPWFACLVILLAPTMAHGDASQVQFTDVTAQAGIEFRHVNGAKGECHLPETMGAGGAFFDYDTDGNLDLYLINSGDLTGASSEERVTSVLYRNNGDGTFTDTTAQAGVGNAPGTTAWAPPAPTTTTTEIPIFTSRISARTYFFEP